MKNAFKSPYSFITIMFLLVSFTPLSSFAGNLFIEINANYSSDTDDVETYKYGTTIAQGFLGAAINKSGSLVFGQNVVSFARNYTEGGLDYTFSTLELGPRFNWYMDAQRTWMIKAIWNPFAQGTRTNASVTHKIKGSSMEFGLGYQIKVSKNLYLGLIMTYHALTITTLTDSANAETTVSQSYTSIYPMFSMNLRF